MGSKFFFKYLQFLTKQVCLCFLSVVMSQDLNVCPLPILLLLCAEGKGKGVLEASKKASDTALKYNNCCAMRHGGIDRPGYLISTEQLINSESCPWWNLCEISQNSVEKGNLDQPGEAFKKGKGTNSHFILFSKNLRRIYLKPWHEYVMSFNPKRIEDHHIKTDLFFSPIYLLPHI